MLLYRIVRGRPRLFLALLAGIAVYPLLPRELALSTRGIVAWDTFALVFLLLCVGLFTTEREMARDAAAQEEGEWTVFLITVVAICISFGAMILEFGNLKSGPAAQHGLRICLVVATLVLSWLVNHTVFALRYAHEYYSRTGGPAVDGGLSFPGDEPPDYWDFFYFAVVLGMTFQVSDVQITSRKLRRLATIHGLIGFVFNTVVLALSVNLGAGLLSPA